MRNPYQGAGARAIAVVLSLGLLVAMDFASAAPAVASDGNRTALTSATIRVPCTGGSPLVAAINGANTGGPGTIILRHGCTYTLNAPDNYWYGPNGLPPIASAITIEGNGATIAREAGSPPFRFFYVGADPANPNTFGYTSPGAGSLTLHNLTLTGGWPRAETAAVAVAAAAEAVVAAVRLPRP